jgi:hypothetical protein
MLAAAKVCPVAPLTRQLYISLLVALGTLAGI